MSAGGNIGGWWEVENTPVRVLYRRKEAEQSFELHGPVGVLIFGDTLKTQHVPREELGTDMLDLRPIKTIAIFKGRSGQMRTRVREFLEKDPSFRGAFLLGPGGGNLDTDEGYLFFTHQDVLDGVLKKST